MSDTRFSQVIEAFSSAKSAIIAAHISPDADAIGSSGPLAYYLRNQGLDVTWYLQDNAPAKFSALIEGLELTNKLPQKQFDLAIITDTASKARIGRKSEEFCRLGRKVINIDHHVSNDGWGDINIVDPTSPSSSLIVFELFEALKSNVPSYIQDLLLAGLMDDTGNFRFSNVDARALLVASKMVAAGANPAKISNALYYSTSFPALKLKAEALSNITLELEDQVGFLSLSRKLLDRSKATESDSEGLIDEVRSIAGTVASVFMREIEPGKWKLSIRSKLSELDVNKVAQAFSGGGHVAAAGCTIVGSAEEAKEKILARLATELNAIRRT